MRARIRQRANGECSRWKLSRLLLLNLQQYKTNNARTDSSPSRTPPHEAIGCGSRIASRLRLGSISQWISDGKIDGDALDGQGPRAKIRVAVADEQLRQRLDLVQRIGNGLATRLDASAAQAAEQIAPAAAAAAPASSSTALEEAFKRGRLEALERENRRRAEEEAARAGRFVDSQTARAELAKIAGRAVSIVDGALPEIAARFALPQRDILHVLRAEFRGVRSRAARKLRDDAAALPELIEAEFDPDRGSSV